LVEQVIIDMFWADHSEEIQNSFPRSEKYGPTMLLVFPRISAQILIDHCH